MNNQIPYKLSNVIYHLPKLLDSFSAGGLREVKNYFKLNGYDLTIQHYGVETLLDIIMKEICVEGNWNELSYNMEYNNFEKKQLSLFFKNFYNNYANKTLMYQEFFAELLQSNLNDLDYDGFVANAYYTISNSISLEIEIDDSGDALRIKDNNNVSDWLPIDYKFDEYSVNEEDTFPYVMYGEMEIDLNNVMRIDNNDLENEITADTLINDDLENDIYDNYEIEINTLDILKKYQEEKSLKGNAEFTLESDDNTYQVEFEYLNNSNQLNLFDIETLDGIVVEFNKNNLEIIKNEIIHQLNMYNELNIEEDNSFSNKLILSTIFDSEINFNEFIERIENYIFDDKSIYNIRNIIYGGFTTQDKINEIGKFIFNNLTELVNNIFDYSDFEKENLLNNFGDDEREEIFYQLSKDIVNFENKYIYANSYDEDDGLDEEELENERPFQPEDQNLLLTILDNLDRNFPTPRVEFYYPFENVECSTLMSLEKINNFLSVENEDYESIMVVDDYKLVSLMPDIIEFEDLLRRLYTNIPEFPENDEDILYMNLSDGTNSIKLKIYISGELHDILAN